MKKKMNVILSLVLAFVLTAGSVNASALFTKSVDEVKAGDLTEISWETFGATYGTTYAAGSNEWSTSLKASTLENLNDTRFKGDVIFADNTVINYGGISWVTGLSLQVNNGQFQVSGYTHGTNPIFKAKPEVVLSEGDATKYGLKSFVNTRFTLEIQMTNLTEQKATVQVLINGKALDEITLETSNYNETTYKLGTMLYVVTGSVQVLKVKPELTEIDWEDFGATYGKTYTAGTNVWDTYLTVASRTDLNNTKFRGDVIFSDNTTLLYAGSNWCYGLCIKVENGSFKVTHYNECFVTTPDLVECTETEATKYGLKSFVDTQFTLELCVTEWTDNQSVVVDVLINGYAVCTTKLARKTGGDSSWSLGTRLSVVTGSIQTMKTMPKLTEITWKDFEWNGSELVDGTNVKTDRTYKYTGGTTLNNTAFTGDVKIPEGGGFRYAVVSSWHGLTFTVSDEQLIVKGSQNFKVGAETTGAAQAFALNPQEYELGSFSDTRFTIRIELCDLSEDNLSASMNLFINEKEVGTDIPLQGSDSNSAFFLSNQIGFGTNGLEEGCTVYDVMKNVPVPTDLTSLSWEEFGYTGSVESTYNTTVTNYSASHLDTLVGTMFNGDVTMQSGKEIRYAETADKNAGGVSVKVNADGTLTAGIVNNGVSVKSYTVNGAYYGVDTFISTQFNLKIAVMTKNKVGVWVNGIIVGDLFETEAKNLTLGTTLYMVNAGITPISSRTTVPTGLTSISFDDWTVEGANKVSLDGKLRNAELSGMATTVSMVNTSLYEVVKFVDTNDTVGHHLLVYGGSKNDSWTGIRIYLDADGNMKLTSNVQVEEKWVSYGSFTIAPQTAGVGESFRGTEFSWQLDTVQVGNHILLYMSFDGQLYNHAPLVFHDFADTISNAMHYNSYEKKEGIDDDETYTQKCANCYVILGSSTKTLATLYHDLDKTATYTFTFTGGVKEFYKKDGKGEWVKQDTIPAGVSETGDYKILFNDGVSDYEQEIICYHYENDVDVTVLVRALKMKDNQTDESWFDYETRLCDKNYDDKVDAEDISTIRKMLLGTYKEDESVMKISGFFSPTAALIKDETYATLKGAGVNHIIETDIAYTDDALARYRIYQELAFAQKYGLSVTVKDGRLDTIGKNNEVTTADYVKQCVANYKGYQSFESLFICDEPKSSTFPMTTVWKDSTTHSLDRYKSVAEAIVAAGYKGWSNAFSMTGTMYNNTYNSDAKYYNRYAYYQYLGSIVDTFKLDFISSTFYPFSEDGLLERYFTTLAMLKDTAEKKSVSYRTFIQAGEGFNDISLGAYTDAAFTEAQFKWNANMNLAFGTSALEYFPLVHPDSFANFSDGSCASGLIDSKGNLTKFGEWATEVNTQAAAADEILLNASNEGYMSTGGYAKSVATDTVKNVNMNTDRTSSEKITNTIYSSYEGATVTASDTANGAFTGCFEITSGDYAGKYAMYIVNYSDVNTNTIKVNFDASKEVTAIYQGVKTTQTGSTYTATLAAGDAVLVVY